MVATLAPSDSKQPSTDCDMCDVTPSDLTSEIVCRATGRFTMMSDPGPPAAWRPAPSSAGLEVAGNLPTLSLGLM